ncbi:NADH dehydrogenase subunit 6 (mitochondrion) [Musca domestica]|uniref:NADH-ubiquinone oxidoreductase chain 6 n=2 Tax=Neoptera TaxID=33340 RepID=B2BX63_MUSDO|nr:NADH dehydrogenase subunit 6 [Musca domestica]YP_009572247.1 NADH dehydrogenase subunit 6 [Dasyhippus barbipes]ABW36040.1 NADH dehydrogenase subunit 6 [Musca domestica]AIL95195.1 NADH dehydrogenase subunit 6 [Musca domestica]ALK60733.1 NADH dehydrogenase subunit 6 [Musca domestica]AMH85185.1 NADH dehydrogenase subunit 6 [Musca domestica]AMH85198.1 NADH dehydrogenase subunit 6 [Musca domestica]
MMQWILMTLLFIFNFIIMNIKHPLAMGLTLLIQTILVSMISGLMTKTFWFSYILFLVFLGGMLVLFIYVTSLASNEMFTFSSKILISSISIFFIMIISLYFIDKSILLNYSNMEIQSISNLNSYMMENSLSLNKLYNYPTNLLTILLMNYLLITLIAVVKITNLFKGPLRPMFN